MRRTRGRSPRPGAARQRGAWQRGAWRRGRAAPAIGVRVRDRRTGPVMPSRCPARRAGPRRPVKAVRVRWHPAPVRQPALPAGSRPAVGRPAVGRPAIGRPAIGHGAATRDPGVRRGTVRHAAVRGAGVRHRPVGRAAIWVPAVRYAGARRSARHRAVGPATTGHAVVTRHATVARDAVRRDSARREPARLARLAWVRASRLAEPLLPGRHIARAAQQLPVVVFLGVYRSARPGGIVLLGRVRVAIVGRVGSWAVAATIPLASRRTVRVTAEAGVATFHQLPPGPKCPAAPRDICPYLLSVGRQKSPVGPRRLIVTNCTQSGSSGRCSPDNTVYQMRR